MATVRLSDAVIPSVYDSYTAMDNPELTALLDAGVVVNSPVLAGIAATGGTGHTIPYWLDLDPGIEPNYSNDDPADRATPNKIGSGSMFARKAFLNQSYSSMQLVPELTGSNPMQRIKDRFGTYWARQMQRRVIATLQGVVAANVADNAGDMGIDASAANIDSDTVIDALATMGDAQKVMGTMLVHSATRTALTKQNDVTVEPDALNPGQFIEVYKNMRLVVDDSMPILSGTGATRVFLSLFLGGAAIGFGGFNGGAALFANGSPLNASWVEFDNQAGNGGGEESIGERKTWLLHPAGFTWTDPTGPDALTEFSPTLADLRKAAPWTRVAYRKQVPLAWLKHLAT